MKKDTCPDCGWGEREHLMGTGKRKTDNLLKKGYKNTLYQCYDKRYKERNANKKKKLKEFEEYTNVK